MHHVDVQPVEHLWRCFHDALQRGHQLVQSGCVLHIDVDIGTETKLLWPHPGHPNVVVRSELAQSHVVQRLWVHFVDGLRWAAPRWHRQPHHLRIGVVLSKRGGNPARLPAAKCFVCFVLYHFETIFLKEEKKKKGGSHDDSVVSFFFFNFIF